MISDIPAAVGVFMLPTLPSRHARAQTRHGIIYARDSIARIQSKSLRRYPPRVRRALGRERTITLVDRMSAPNVTTRAAAKRNAAVAARLALFAEGPSVANAETEEHEKAIHIVWRYFMHAAIGACDAIESVGTFDVGRMIHLVDTAKAAALSGLEAIRLPGLMTGASVPPAAKADAEQEKKE